MEIENFEETTIDSDDFAGTDIKINPDFYIHHALLKAQIALTKDNMKEGFVQFRLIIEHIEVLCKSASMITKEYDAKIKEYQSTKEYKEETQDLIKSVKLANKKLEILMNEVFNKKTSIVPLRA